MIASLSSFIQMCNAHLAELDPSDAPTTPFPTPRPTYAVSSIIFDTVLWCIVQPLVLTFRSYSISDISCVYHIHKQPCAGDPCPNKDHCRSNQNFCGPGEFYCNEKSIWRESCGNPTDPPTSSPRPTNIPTSSSPTMSSRPTKAQTNPPVSNLGITAQFCLRSLAALDTDCPSAKICERSEDCPAGTYCWAAKMCGSAITDAPTVSPRVVNTASPTKGNNSQEFGPNDPRASFFCGESWNQAITECSYRCPSGESDQCPGKMSCYAGTPCYDVGVPTPPTKKPTWEPTNKPTPSK